MDNRQVAFYIAALVSTINASEDGVPSGHAYAAFMSQGMSFDEYSSIVDVLKRNKYVTESGHLLRITAEGKALAAKIDAVIR